jgi:peptidoglycan hydrolase CwlO-like protein
MLGSWMLITFNIVAALYTAVIILYYRNVITQEKNKVKGLKLTLGEAEILIKKYQIQLQKVLGSVDNFYSELSDARNDLKTIKARYAHLKSEDTKNRKNIEKLESKINSLM